MEIKQFIERVEEALSALKGTIRETDRLADLDGWDSVGALSVIALIDEDYGVALDVGAFGNCKTVVDLLNLVKTKSDSK